VGQPLDWMLISGRGKQSGRRALRNRLAVTTILAVAPFLSYGRQAYAACEPAAAPLTHLCSGTDAGQFFISVDNANFATAGDPPYVVTESGLGIVGQGNQRFTDNYASTSITNGTYYGRGLSVVSTGDIEETPGAVTIFTNGTISGTAHGIYARNAGSGDLTITANGSVTGTDFGGDPFVDNDGIYAKNFGANLTVTTGIGSTITGEHNGIDARNYGSGNLTIATYGEVTGNSYDAIYAVNSGAALRITVAAPSVVKGFGYGIGAFNNGSGDLEIKVDGSVTSEGYDGIHARNEGANLIITTGVGSSVRGEGPAPESEDDDSNGIDAVNYGSGYLKITADGEVFGNFNDGIFAKNYGTDLTIATGAQSVVKGGGHGIGAHNYGIGKLDITADGVVGGYSEDGDGIYAVNHNNQITIIDPYLTRDMTITTGGASQIRGVADGIDGRNYANGSLTITAQGEVTGQNGDGIFARNVAKELWVGGGEPSYGKALGLTITTESTSTVTGNQSGIYAQDTGYGDFLITANGRVTGETRDGIYGLDGSEGLTDIGGDFTIVTGAGSIVSGNNNGIMALNYGSGSLKIEANGQVTGLHQDGIHARNDPYGGDDDDLTISTGLGSAVTGGKDGIDAEQDVDGSFKITVEGTVTGLGESCKDSKDSKDSKDDCKDSKDDFGFGIKAVNYEGDSATEIEIGTAGLVQGRVAGIFARSLDDQAINIDNAGIVRNLSQSSGDLAILAIGGATHIGNTGAIIGTVLLSSFNDTFDNDGLWSMTGESDFGNGDEDEVNNSGVLLAAIAPGASENPLLTGLERFNNSGAISLIDGGAEDTLEITGVLAGETEYTSEGGLLGVDAILGPDGKADELHISGNVTGQTKVHVNVVGATGFNDEGIAVVRVFSGDTTDGDFVLDGPVTAGFYTWDLRYDDTLNQHELFSSGVGIGAEEFGAGMTATQDLWFQTLGTLLGRQMDLRSLIGGTGVTPVADFAEPVSPTPVAKVTPGFWVSGLGAYLKRDDEEDGFTLDRTQTIWGGLAGFDFGTQDVGDALLFGVFGGYMTSQLKFDETNTEWNYEGPTLGVYATYLDRAFFVDVTVKADFLDIEIDPEDLAPDADDGDTDALNIGGRIDTGYKFGESMFVEPQASLAVVHSEIDDVDVFGGTVEFDDETSVRGRLGLRVGFDHQASDATIFTGDVIASVWEDFSGDNNATIADPALPSFGVSDDPGSTMGDISIGFGVAAPEGWSGFLRGNYQFATDYDAYSGNAGLRYSW
jgi:autotransporter family porin